MSDKPPVLLIDLSALFHPAWRSIPFAAPLSVAFEATLGGVRRCIANAPGALVAVCCDGKGNWRKKESPTYKANREALPNVFYAEFDRVKARLKADGLLLWQADGYEADDLIAQATELARHAGHEVRIASHDKDMLQLVSDNAPKIDYLSTNSFNVMTFAGVVEKFGVAPEQLGDWLALVGDKSDNVPGCPGCGPVNAAKLLNRCKDLADLAIELDRDAASVTTPKMAQALRENWAQIELARKLVDFRTDAPINFDEIYEERKPQPLTDKENDMNEPEDFDRTPEPVSTKVEAGPEDAISAGPGVPQGLVTRDKTPAEIAEASAPRQTDQALVVVEYSKQLEPRSFREATIFAKWAFDSRLYQKFGSVEAIAVVIARGREIGLGAGAALEVFHIIEGRPYPFAYLIAALCRKDVDCEYLLPIEQDEKHAIAETKHRASGKVLTFEYTYEQAVKAKLPREGAKGPNGWLKNPEDMLVKTALAKLGRRIYSGAALGLTSLEEIGEA